MEPLLRVAFVCPRMTNAFSRTIWYALREAAPSLGVRLTAVMGGPIDHPRQAIPARRVYDLIDPANFDGVLLHSAALSYYSDEGSMHRFLDQLKPLPVVSLGLVMEGVPSVALDQAEGVRAMVRHLHDVHGYQRLAFVSGPLEQIEARLRLEAFRAAATEVGCSDVQEFPGAYDRDSGAAAVRELAHDGRPVALLCTNDEEALGALDEAKALGLSVPGQLAVAGFDDIELAPLHEPSLTTVGQPLIRQATQALRLLAGLLRGETAESIVESAPLYFRESCGCLPTHPAPRSDKSSLLVDLMATQSNATEDFVGFLHGWLADYFTAFEYLLETGNPSVLRQQWSRYYARINPEHERGLSFRRLFAGLQSLFGERPGYDAALQENLVLAGAAESRKGSRDDRATRQFFFLLHSLEVQISQVNDRAGLAALPGHLLARLGVRAVALVRFGAPSRLVHFHGATGEQPALPTDYPTLLPASVPDDPSAPRLVVALTAEQNYLGYAVFWLEGRETFVCDFLANQFAGALHRLELVERIGEQRRSLEESLDETRRMQKQLVETEKVASLGRLVAGVAHEINTPLGTGITGTSFLLERLAETKGQFDAGTLARSGLAVFLDQGHEALEGVLRSLLKAGELIQAFKGLGPDHGRAEWRPVALDVLFHDLGQMYAGEFSRRGIELRTELSPTTVFSQPSALVQVAGELLENAMDHAFPSSWSGEPQVLLQAVVEDGVLRLAVTDNGRGLSAEERRHLFDPLFTTQRPQGHAGLGLHLAFQLMTRTLGGQMTVASEPGSGSCFLCLIPLKTG